jgi:hypothetical protein
MADQLTIITSLTDQVLDIIQQDPVRPHITAIERVAANREVFIINDGLSVKSVLCVAYLSDVPKTEFELLTIPACYNIACLYSIWSNERGYGKKLLNHSLTHIRFVRPYINRVVTLSPKTDVATKFHLANGAKLFRENEDSVNYEYPY